MDVKDKIAKLLALADSSNEHEARAALLKARELMAENKLRPDDIKRTKDMKVIRRVLDITCTKMTNPWAVELALSGLKTTLPSVSAFTATLITVWRHAAKRLRPSFKIEDITLRLFAK